MSLKYRVWQAVAELYAPFAPRAPRPGLRVFCYHAVQTEIPGDPYGLSLSRAKFARQMELLASGEFGEPVSLSRAVEKSDKPRVCATFDDGYIDALTIVAPLMETLKLPYTVCVTPGLLGSTPAHLTPTGLAELARKPGCEIGAHGLNHKKLSDLSDADLDRELHESRKVLRDATGQEVLAMSYPHGLADCRVRAAAERAGYKVAACSRYGLNDARRDRLMLCRTEIVAWDGERTFRQKALGGWDWYALRHPDPLDENGPK